MYSTMTPGMWILVGAVILSFSIAVFSKSISKYFGTWEETDPQETACISCAADCKPNKMYYNSCVCIDEKEDLYYGNGTKD